MVREAPRQTAGPAPLRVPGSVRRTSSIDVSWPEGREGNMRLDGRARDVVTPKTGGAPITKAEDSYVASLKPDRTIAAIAATPNRPAIARLVGQRGGGHLRLALKDLVPEERENATPLYLVLDDISGSSLVAGWAWLRWDPNWLNTMRAKMSEPQFAKMMADREGVCTGFAPGSTALSTNPGGTTSDERTPGTPVPDLRNPQDPEGWHAFTVQDKVGMRRARRIDVRREKDVIAIEAAFQDSASLPDSSGRAAIHEYTLTATADPSSYRVLTLAAQPRILPFPECPGATANLVKLIGTPLPELREKVLAELKGTAGCTHLNDAMRALAEVPALVKYL